MGALSGGDRSLAGRAIGVYGSAGAPYPHLAFAALHGTDVRIVRAEDVAAGRLAELDALVMPGGGLRAMAGLLAPLGTEGAARIRRFVEEGGLYLSSCAGSVLPLALEGAAEAAHPEAASMRMVEVAMANPGDATLGGLASPGVGRVRVRVDRGSPLAAGVPDTVELVHYNGPFFASHQQADRAEASSVRPFAWPVAAGDAFTPAERFLPGAEATAETTFDACVRVGASTGVTTSVGRGRAVLFGSHPEFGLGPLQLGWGDGARLLAAAMRSAPARGRGGSSGPSRYGPWHADPARPEADATTVADGVATELRASAERFARLADRDDGGWLDAGHAPSFHGATARDAWRRDAVAAAGVARAAARVLDAVAPKLDGHDRGWLDDRPRPDQDVGAMGLLQMVARVRAALDVAEARLEHPVEVPAHAYDGLETHPFHLAVGTYLSAAGLIAAAALVAAVLATRHAAPLGPLDPILFRAGAADAPGAA